MQVAPYAGIVMALTAILMTGCVYLPHTTAAYDKDCGAETKSMTLEAHQVASLGQCSNEGCVAWLVAAGVVGAATAVVSGSVVVAGNVVYWVEEKRQCLKLK
jgi:hypothetical protein